MWVFVKMSQEQWKNVKNGTCTVVWISFVPNAGVSKGVPKNLHSDQDWDYVVNINPHSVYWLCHDAYPLLKASKRGKIITIGSEYSLHGSMRTIGYAASKHGVIGLTKSLAVSWASDDIQANCIIPGWILTDLAKPAIEHPIVGKAILKVLDIRKIWKDVHFF